MWLISVPVWGDEFIVKFKNVGLPLLRAAAEPIKEQGVQLVVHTDQPDRFINLGLKSRVLWPPAGAQWFNTLSRAHSQVLTMATPNDIVVLLTADMVISTDALTACKRHFDQGKRLICCHGLRVLDSGVLPYHPKARELSEWGWRNRHPMVRDATWPNGQGSDLTRIYFENGNNVVCRLWLPHPLALKPHGRRVVFGPTIDCDLITNFIPSESHLVTDADELSAIELSPTSKTRGSYDLDEKIVPVVGSIQDRYYKALPRGVGMYQWALSKRIVVSGTGQGCGDYVVERRV